MIRTPELPLPTADELAAIRARLDGRQARRGRVRRLVGWAAFTLVVVLLVMDASYNATEMAGDRLWRLWSALLVLAPLSALDTLLVAVRVDAAVRARIGAPAGPEPAERSPARLTGSSRLLLAAALVAAVTALLMVTRAATSGVPGASWLSCRLLALGLVVLAASVLIRVRRPVVGSGPILTTVDGALLRRDLARILSPAMSMVLPGLPVILFDPASTQFEPWAYVLQGLVLAAVPTILDGDRGLLSDYRIKLASPPEVWLADREVTA